MIPDPDLNPQGNKNAAWLEPIEECTVVVREEYAGGVVRKLTLRKGEMKSYESRDPEGGRVKVVMDVPARGLIGYMAGEFGNDVHGQGMIIHIFKGYEGYKGAMDTGRNSAFISMALGESSGYAMAPLQARGTLFVLFLFVSKDIPILFHIFKVYPGMVIVESSKTTDLYLNLRIKKQLTNIRVAVADDKIVLSSLRVMGLEALAYMGDNEIVVVTPGSV